MAMTIHIWDEVVPGRRSSAESVTVPVAETTVREFIRARVLQEVDRFNQSRPDVFCGLVQPEESERVLNGYRLREPRQLDGEAQFRRACTSFEKNGFLVLIDGSQVTELDQPISLHEESEVQFVKLVPLVGG